MIGGGWMIDSPVERLTLLGRATGICYVLSTLVLIFSYMSRSIMINHDSLNFIE